MLRYIYVYCMYLQKNSDFWLLVYTTLREWFCITEVQSTDCVLCTDTVYKIDYFVFKAVRIVCMSTISTQTW